MLNTPAEETDFNFLAVIPEHLIAAAASLNANVLAREAAPVFNQLAKIFPKPITATRQILEASTTLVNPPPQKLEAAPVVPIPRGQAPSNPQLKQ